MGFLITFLYKILISDILYFNYDYAKYSLFFCKKLIIIAFAPTLYFDYNWIKNFKLWYEKISESL